MPASLTHLAPIDLALVALYLVGITLFGLRFSKSTRSLKATQAQSLKTYFLADNTIPWWAIALSIVSAETSTLTIVSIPGVAYAGNLGFLQVVLGYMLGRIVVAALFLPKYFRGEMLTAYQLIDRRFGPPLHKLTAGLFLLTRAAAEGVRVFAISIVVSIAIGTGDTLSIAIISALTLLYTFEGGMAAVIWTDVLQMALYVAGTVIALITLGARVPGGWTHIHAIAAPLGKFHWLDFTFTLTKSYTFWAGILGGTFLTMASHGTDQLMVQRMLAARNLRESRLALLSSGVVIFIQFTLFLVIGVGLFVFYGTHPATFKTNDHIFPTFIVQEMPHGIAGLLIAAILAAAMSNLSAALNSLASTTVIDFYVPWQNRNRLRTPQRSITDTTKVSRLSTVFWAVVLFAIATYCVHAGGKGHVVETGLSIASVAYGCLLGVFLLGTLTRYATQTGAILGMITGLATNLILWQASLGKPFVAMPALPHIAFTWYVLIGSLMTFAVGTLFSFVVPRRRSLGVALVLFALIVQKSICQPIRPPLSAPSSQAIRESVASVSPPDPYDFTPITTLLNRAITDQKLPGAVVILGHDGKVVFKHAYGNRTLAPVVEAMTDDTVFDMASLTKVLVTSTAILQLVEQHKLDLDIPLAHYLPAFAGGGKEKISVRLLLTHYSGLPEDIDLKDPWGLTKPDRQAAIERALAAVPYGPPGITFKYSDINFILLGALVEQVSGQSLDVYAREHIFIPLGMTHTAYHPFAKTCGPATRFGANVEPGPKPIGRILVACPPNTWSPYALDPETAPTAHDDQGTAATNPDYDRLLRGIVHDPTTRRMGGVAGHAGVFSTGTDMALFCQALLDKLRDDTGPFPLLQATLKMAVMPNEPPSAAETATVFTQNGQTTKGEATRGLGWDLNTAYSRARGEIFALTDRSHQGSFGHTGFTGTSLWLDPASDTYVILLTNAIHIQGAASISPLRGQLATAAARILISPSAPSFEPQPKGGVSRDAQPSSLTLSNSSRASNPTTATGIDVLEQTNFAALKALRHPNEKPLKIAVLTNQSGLDRYGHRTIDLLLHASPTLQLTAIFTPEHGLAGRQDTDHFTAEQDATTHLPVISLYGPTVADKHPKLADLEAVDAIVIDLQDAGVRFWTYEAVLGYMLEAAAQTHRAVVVLDRPNPISGGMSQGPVSDAHLNAYTNYMPLPIRHGLTFGELARYFNASLPKPAPLTVVFMQGWHRTDFYADTGLPWLPPSPNLKTLAATILYPAVGLIEQTNLSVGRGTATPFEHLGAAWIDGPELARTLTARQIPGIAFTPTTLTIAETPEHYPGHGQTIPGIHLEVTDRLALDSPELGMELLAALHDLYPKQFQMERAHTLMASAATFAALEAGKDPRVIAAMWVPALATFRNAAAPYLLYP